MKSKSPHMTRRKNIQMHARAQIKYLVPRKLTPRSTVKARKNPQCTTNVVFPLLAIKAVLQQV